MFTTSTIILDSGGLDKPRKLVFSNVGFSAPALPGTEAFRFGPGENALEKGRAETLGKNFFTFEAKPA